MGLIQLETEAAEPVVAQGTRITAFRRKLRLRLPGLDREFTWARPLAVLVQTPDGGEVMMPAAEMAADVQTGLAVLTGIGLILLLWLFVRRLRPPDRNPRGE